MDCHKIPISGWIKPLSYKKTELFWSITDIFPIYLWQKFSHIGIVRVKKMGSVLHNLFGWLCGLEFAESYKIVETARETFFRTKFEKWHLAIFESRQLNFLASRASPTENHQGLKRGGICQLSRPDLTLSGPAFFWVSHGSGGGRGG